MQTIFQFMKSPLWISFIFFSLLTVGCKREEPEQKPKPVTGEVPAPVVEPLEEEILMDQVYGTDIKQKFDIFLPANRTAENTPVLFLLHGGSWRSGSKNSLHEMIEGLRTSLPEYAFVAIGYRLYQNGTNKFPTQEEDVKSCIEFVLDRGDEFQISDKFAIWGSSAGAHLGTICL
jgi:acetyl esterase/lipase